MKKFLLAVLAIIIILIIIIFINTLLFRSKQTGELGKRISTVVSEQAVKHLSEAIRIKTVSYDEDSLIDHAAFDSLKIFLKKNYPLVFEKLLVQEINQYSLLLKWSGKGNRQPAIFFAHLDVVPADTTTGWTHQPFDGIVDDKFIYGRGAIDDKGSVIGIMEAIQILLQKNFVPSGDLYFAFGHDEETGGENGAAKIAAKLKEQNINAEFLIDEGGLIATDMVPFVGPPVAMIFTSEKGYLSLDLTVKGEGGHSGFPRHDSPVEILSRAIISIQDNPFETRITESVSDFMDYTGPEMKFPFKSLFANRWLFGSVIKGEYKKIPSAKAMISTTSVPTIINAGNKENVVPSSANATINFRLLPGDKSQDIITKIKSVINDDRVIVSVRGKAEEPSEVSSHTSESFILLQQTIKKVYPDAVVAPSLLIAQTDSRHFRSVTKNIYRFLPVRMDDKILDGMHGKDEKIGIHDFMESILFYETFIGSL